MNNSYFLNNFVNRKHNECKENVVYNECINSIYVKSCLNQIPMAYLKLSD
jgi:hypothetical protein